MASSSSSSSKHWIYDVFLSFRGEDTRQGFTAHLYKALEDEKVKVFIDKELRRGGNITEELLQAIQGSRISLIVFSKRYADSSWCLEELVQIMECRRTSGQIVFPIFYYVDPSHARYQTGGFADAFQKHEERVLTGLDMVVRWRCALTEAANLSGWHLSNTAERNEAELIQKIVDEITTQLESTYLDVAVYPVGMDSRVEEISNSLSVGSHDVRMVGIWGMGGIGKTAVAKAIYNKFYHCFEGKSFLANIRETAKEKNGIITLQEKLLSDILRPTKIEVGDADRGINVLKKRLGCKKVLVIVDDVDHMDQLNALAINRDAYGPGSRLVITTRDRHLLDRVKVHKIHETQKMSQEEALQLFSWHAFRNCRPNGVYAELSRSVLAYCGGLPLALEVLGSFLFGRNQTECKSALEKLERIPDEQIQKILRISFDAIDENQRDIFLHISCFFIGMDKNHVIKILDGCGLFAEIGISVLLQRCLVTVSEKNKLMMHDLVRDMGREIVRAKSPNCPEKCSRLWHQEDVIDVLTEESGNEEIEGLALNLRRSDKKSFSTKAFKNMKRLKLLQLNYVQLTGDYNYLSEKLRWLCWRGLPLKFIPNDFLNQTHLVSIDLRYSNLVQVWEHSRSLEKLKILNLSHSHYLKQSPDFSSLLNLENLIFKDCKSLSTVHHSIGILERLSLVNLKDCIMLTHLPRSFYKLKSVETLILSGCSRFERLDGDIGEMVSLTTLLLGNTSIRPFSEHKGEILSVDNLLADDRAIRELPSSIGILKNLKYLSLRSLKVTRIDIHSLDSWSLHPSPFQCLTSLLLPGCNLTDDAIPKDLGSLSCLKYLNLRGNSFDSLPSLRSLSNLERLSMNDCTYLHTIEDLPTSLKELEVDHCTALTRMPNFSEMLNIRLLHLSHSPELIEFPGLDKSLNSITLIRMERCTNITTTLKETILKGWTASGDGGIFLPGCDIPKWFAYVNNGARVCFQVPQIIGSNLKALTVCIVYSSCLDKVISLNRISILVVNRTKLISFVVRPAYPYAITSLEVIWLGHLSNNEFHLEGSDFVEVYVVIGSGFRVKKTGQSSMGFYNIYP